MILDLIYKIPLIYYALSGLINFITSFSLGLFVYFKNKKAKTNRVFAFFCLTVAQWSLFYFVWLRVKDPTLAEFYLRTCMIGVAFMPAVFTHFVLYLLNIKPDKRLLRINYLISTGITLMVYTPLYAYDGGPFLVFPYWGKAGLIFPLHLIHFFLNVIYSHYKMIHAIKEEKGLLREQVRYVFIGTTIGYLAGVTNYFCWYRIGIPPFPNVLISLYVASVAYAIIRFRLMDIRLAITRTVLSIAVFGAISVLPYAILLPFRSYLHSTLGSFWWLLPMGISAYGLIAATTPFTYLYFQRRIERGLLREDRKRHRVLNEFSKHVILIKDIDSLLNSIVATLSEVLSVRHVAVYLYDKGENKYVLKSHRSPTPSIEKFTKEDPLIQLMFEMHKPILYEEIMSDYKNTSNEKMDVALEELQAIKAMVIVPNFVDDDLIAFVALGEKEEGTMYTEDDINVLTLLANQSALAIGNAQYLKEREEMQARLREMEKFKAIGELLGSLRHEMGNILNNISTPLQMMKMGDYKDKPEKEKKALGSMIKDIFKGKTVLKYVDDYKEKSASGKIALYNLRESIDKGLSHSKDLMEKWHIRMFTTIDPRINIKGKETLPDIFKYLIINSCYGMEILQTLREAGERDTEKKTGELGFSANINKETDTVEIIQTDTGLDLTKEIKTHKTMGGELFAEQGKLGGINLFLARRIILDHNGSLIIKSNKGKGTKFIVRLPLDFTKAGKE